ncbi:hypothetical protein VNO80_26117 [Phaseolus coccineus]|uniref:Uncharacterized protein n=1 Tax=Phaseolus coccineus TaxID=3886 RepID=A0AAN9LW11_PHACN
MGTLMLLKNFTLLFLLLSASLLSTSFAARRSKAIRNFTKDVNANKEGTTRKALSKEEVSSIHERVLRANTKDYGRYDPSPSLSKPPFKLIPN